MKLLLLLKLIFKCRFILPSFSSLLLFKPLPSIFHLVFFKSSSVPSLFSYVFLVFLIFLIICFSFLSLQQDNLLFLIFWFILLISRLSLIWSFPTLSSLVTPTIKYNICIFISCNLFYLCRALCSTSTNKNRFFCCCGCCCYCV